jgi:hypothetical protein
MDGPPAPSGETCSRFTAPLVAAGPVIATDQVGISAYSALIGAPRLALRVAEPSDTVTPDWPPTAPR